MISVKLAQLPGAMADFVLEDGATVTDLLEIAGKDADGFAVTVNGSSADLGTTLSDGATVILSKSAKGNS